MNSTPYVAVYGCMHRRWVLAPLTDQLSWQLLHKLRRCLRQWEGLVKVSRGGCGCTLAAEQAAKWQQHWPRNLKNSNMSLHLAPKGSMSPAVLRSGICNSGRGDLFNLLLKISRETLKNLGTSNFCYQNFLYLAASQNCGHISCRRGNEATSWRCRTQRGNRYDDCPASSQMAGNIHSTASDPNDSGCTIMNELHMQSRVS